MLGVAEAGCLRIWVRTSEPLRVTAEVSTSANFDDSLLRSTVETTVGNDCAAAIAVRGLQPATRYYYRLLLNDKPYPNFDGAQPWSAQTAPADDDPRPFSLAFGSCASFLRDAEQPIWHAIAASKPDLFLWLGDNIYGDSLWAEAIAEEYRRQRGVPSFQPLARNTPQFAIWDDHDYGLNDHDRENPVKEDALLLFKRYWANPAYGTPDTPGVFFRQRWGRVELFMLDSRYHRDPNTAPDVPGKTMLGRGQLEWLKQGLVASTADFKLLACGSGWTCAKGPGGDSWSAFLHERDALFDFIRERGIRGVVLLSGDTHTGELNAIPCSQRGGYDLYDLVSSPLARRPEHEWQHRYPERRIREPFDQDNNYGFLEFRFDGEPRLRYTLLDSRGRAAMAPLELAASDLHNGVVSWDRKADPAWRDARAPASGA